MEAEQTKPVYLSRYTPDTFYGRYRLFLQRTNPLYMFITDSQLSEFQQTVETAKKNDWNLLKEKNITQENVYEASAIVESLVHPQTGKPMNRIGTFPFFTTTNLPIITGMLVAPPTLFHNVFWQWINQTYNAFFNDANANKSTNQNEQNKTFFDKYGDFLMGYSGAVVVSVGLAVGLNSWLKNAKISDALRTKLRIIVPYTAVASAGVSNIALMRYKELVDGVPVYTPQGEYIGMSKYAAKLGVGLSAVSRAVLPMPLLLIPPMVAMQLMRFKLVSSNKFFKLLTDVATVAVCLQFGLPAAVAMFPQNFSIPFSSLEKDLQKSYFSNPTHTHTSHVIFNKGV